MDGRGTAWVARTYRMAEAFAVSVVSRFSQRKHSRGEHARVEWRHVWSEKKESPGVVECRE